MDDPDNLDPDEREVHSLFAVLRNEVVHVSDAFVARLERAIEHASSMRGASPPGLFATVLVEAMNLLSAALGASGEDDQGPEDED
jgi:hypothetical protein